MIAIIDYGAGNIRSVKYALDRIGASSVLTGDPEVISNAAKVIFPGVGEARSAMTTLKKNGLARLIPELQQPVLGICLGMQLLCEFSEEGNTPGMGIFQVEVKRFRTDLKVPHIGWNTIFDLQTALFEKIPENTYTYFVHSYYVPENEHTIASTEYGLRFSSALRKKNFFATQFHPEKSGDAGEQILKNFLNL
jgi:glutamine amidotransferase